MARPDLHLPSGFVAWLAPYLDALSRRTRPTAAALAVGALLAVGPRTVTNCLRALGLAEHPGFTAFHRVLNRNAWSGLALARTLLRAVVAAFAPTGPIIIGVDHTLERRRGPRIGPAGRFYDASRRADVPKPTARGLRWLSAMVLVDIPFAGRIWALPVLSALTPSKAWSERHGRRHRTTTEWARLLLLAIRRWLPDRTIVAVGDGDFAALELLHALRASMVVIARLRKDARLFEPPICHDGKPGRTPRKGQRQPLLSERLTGRPARTRVLPVPHVPDGLSIAQPRCGPAGHRGTATYMPDNGVIERLFRTLKEQIVHGRIFRAIDEVRDAIRAFAARYNAEWLIEKNGHRSPIAARVTWQEQTFRRGASSVAVVQRAGCGTPAPIGDLEVGEVGLTQLVRRLGPAVELVGRLTMPKAGLATLDRQTPAVHHARQAGDLPMDDHAPDRPALPHSAHWGAFSARWDGARVTVIPHPGDPAPSPILGNFVDSLRHRARIARPMVRRGWLERGPGPSTERGRDGFVALPWDEVLDRLAAELRRVKEAHGAGAVYGGSYGWSSAGRFHHAQSQIHRFLNIALGGYVRSVNSYSAGASQVILPHFMGPLEGLFRHNVTWEQVERDTELLLCFGGMALKNSMIASGGVSRHVEPGAIARARVRGARFVLVGPIRDDLPPQAEAEWLPIAIGTDVALMLALCHTLAVEGLHDRAFLQSHAVGYPQFERYLLGQEDGQPKDVAWAAAICGIEAGRVTALARELAAKRSLVTVAHGLQRAQYGEQPVWAAAALATMLGQIGLPGGGYSYAMGAMGHYGRRPNAVPIPTMPQGKNGVRAFIPVARIADMLLNPGVPFDYNGERLNYPDIRLVYWAGGNPFHHHQDLNRLREAFARVDTLVVHETAWTATARHADIVLPVTMTLERDDIGAAGTDPLMVAMRGRAPPFAEARDDYAIFSGLAERLGVAEAFTEGRDAEAWMRHLYEPTRVALAERGVEAPSFDEFWARGELVLPSLPDDGGPLRAFRGNPTAHPLPTPSGKIEIFSETVASFGYSDCPGHPCWFPSSEQPDARHPLRVIANQPAARLHSQLDFGAHSQSSKRGGREVARLHPADAAARGIADGDVIRLFNDRGACLAAASLSDAVAPGVVQISTGAWYDPAPGNERTPLCVHGNPNVLTRDIGTSRLAQGNCGQTTIAEVERFESALPTIRAYDPPKGA